MKGREWRGRIFGSRSMHQTINAGGFCVGCDRAQQERDESVAYEATYIAPSGTALARDDGMLYESPALGETERLRKINDGIINSQAEQAVFKIHDSASEWRGR
jgi:hypothetical protein